MRYRLIMATVIVTVAGSFGVAMAGAPQPTNPPPSIRQGMISSAGGHFGQMPSSTEQLRIGAGTISLGAFARAMGEDEDTSGYRLLRSIVSGKS